MINHNNNAVSLSNEQVQKLFEQNAVYAFKSPLPGDRFFIALSNEYGCYDGDTPLWSMKDVFEASSNPLCMGIVSDFDHTGIAKVLVQESNALTVK